ncbi:hypothetical protein MMC34_000995 [Xylographa carneopallida]|nr:hypothetical protein [Xylographa carneopallida]
MEHLILPIDPLDSDLEIPFVATVYDGGSFLTYPARRRLPWPLSYDQDGLIPNDLYLSLPFMPTSDQEAFFQTWLFFGLLQVFMKDEFDAEHYKESLDGRIRITTARLFQNMRRMWVKQVEQSSKDKVVQFRTVVNCLNLIAQVLRGCNDDFDWRIKLSIASLCEVFSATVTLAYASLGVKQPTVHIPNHLGLHLFEQNRKERMLSAGWCSNDIAIAAERFSSVQTLYFLSRMKKLDAQRDHHGYQDNMCKWNQIKKDQYQTLHVSQTCHCADIILPLHEIELCLSRHRLPLLKLKSVLGDPHELQIEIVEYSGNEKYVAISHVWAYGLGNPIANALPRCQVTHLRKMMGGLRSTAMDESNRNAQGKIQTSENYTQFPLESGADSNIYLWIDTLCCPVGPAESKARAIELLEYTYQKASYVLVLDGGLVVCNYTEIPVYEAIARIFTSAWLQRLWTLQEGVLAGDRLWFQFQDRPVNLKALMHTPFVHEITIQSFRTDMVAQYRIMSMSFLQDEKLCGVELSHGNVGNDLLALDRALRHRSVTVEADEALCICTLLQLPAQDVVRFPEDPEARMSQVWRLIALKYHGVPQRVLLLSLPRLQKKGFRWAPRTLLKEAHGGLLKHSTGVKRSYMWQDPNLGTITESGLLVKWPGFKLDAKDYHDLPVRNPWKGLPRLRESRILFRSDDGTRYQFGSKEHTTGDPAYKHAEGAFPLLDIIQRGNCYLILADGSLFKTKDFTKGIGILGNVIGSSIDGRVLDFEEAEQVLLFKTSEKECFILDTAERVTHQLRAEALTTKLAAMDTDTGTKEYEAVLEPFRQRLDEVCAEEAKNELLTKAIYEVYNGAIADRTLRVLVRDWYCHDIVGKNLDAEQQWYVD